MENFQETLSDATGAGLGSLEFLRNNPQVGFHFSASLLTKNPYSFCNVIALKNLLTNSAYLNPVFLTLE